MTKVLKFLILFSTYFPAHAYLLVFNKGVHTRICANLDR